MIDATLFSDDQFTRLCEIVRALRSPEGCPWDKEQTELTLRDSLLEEAYEAVSAINSHDDAHIMEELGDVLMLIILIGNIRAEAGAFSIEAMLTALNEKLIRRHPHVFGEASAKTSAEVIDQWQRIKTDIEGRAPKDSLIDQVKTHLPVLERAFEVQKKVAKVGFDWENADQVFEKIHEEIDEVKQELAHRTRNEGSQAQARLEEEIGDLLFAVVNLSRKVSVKPQLALDRAVHKFGNRFRYIENRFKDEGLALSKAQFQRMEQMWAEAKDMEAGSPD